MFRMAVVLLLALTWSTPSHAGASAADDVARSAEMMRDAAERMVHALKGLIAEVPRYTAPEVMPNGDIIIRRQPPAAKPSPSTPDETRI